MSFSSFGIGCLLISGIFRFLNVVPSTDVKYIKLSNICADTNKHVYHSLGKASAAPKIRIKIIEYVAIKPLKC